MFWREEAPVINNLIMKRLNEKVSSLIKSQRPIAIHGIGSHTDILFDRVADISRVNVICFIDTNKGGKGLSYRGRMVMTPTDIGGEIEKIIISSLLFQEDIFDYLAKEINFKGDIFKIYNLGEEELNLQKLEEDYSQHVKEIGKLLDDKREIICIIDDQVSPFYIYFVYALKICCPGKRVKVVSLQYVANLFKDFFHQHKIELIFLRDIIQDQSLNNEIYKEHEFFSNDREFTSLKFPDSDLPLWKSIYYDHIAYAMRGDYWLHKPLRKIISKFKFDFLITSDTRRDQLVSTFQIMAQEKGIPALGIQLGNIRDKMGLYLPIRANYFLPKSLSDKKFIENNKKDIKVLEPYSLEVTQSKRDKNKRSDSFPKYITSFIDIDCQWELGQFLGAIVEFERKISKSIQWNIIVKKNYRKDSFSEEEFCKILYHQLLAQISNIQFVEVENSVEEVIDSIKLFISLSCHPYVEIVQSYFIPVVIFDLYNYNRSKNIPVERRKLTIITQKEEFFSYLSNISK